MVTSIAGLGTSFPTQVTQSDIWQKWFRNHYNENPLARRLFDSAGVSTRHAVVEPYVEDVSNWSTEKRMQRYLSEATGLGKATVQSALHDADVEASDVGLFVVTSCTGYVTPGLDVFVAQDVGLPPSVQRVFLGHMGCHAAIPSMQIARNHVAVNGTPALVLCVELPSLHMQPSTNDVEQIVAHSLFSDAAAAIVVTPKRRGFEIVDFVSSNDFDSSALMTWQITDLGFRMGLSQKVPNELAKHVKSAIDSLLQRNELQVGEVRGWAVHPGGPRILDVVQQELRLTDDDLAHSRKTLKNHGNCSSPTVLVVLESLRRHESFNDGDHVVAMAFGPGLTLQAVLLQFHDQ